MTTTVTRTYAMSVSWEDYDPNHGYRRGDTYPLKGVSSREEATAFVESRYPAKGSNSWVAYWIDETVINVSEYVIEGGIGTRKITEEDYLPNAIVVYRSEEDYNEFVLEPLKRREQERQESGEAALEEAYQAEREENVKRVAQGEKPVKDAEHAWLRFKGYPIYEEPKPAKKGLKALFKTR